MVGAVAVEGTAAFFGPLRSLRIAFGVLAAVTLGLGLGAPAATSCTTPSTVTTASGSTAQLTATYETGVYCVRIYDVGNLVAPINFDVSIAHP